MFTKTSLNWTEIIWIFLLLATDLWDVRLTTTRLCNWFTNFKHSYMSEMRPVSLIEFSIIPLTCVCCSVCSINKVGDISRARNARIWNAVIKCWAIWLCCSQLLIKLTVWNSWIFNFAHVYRMPTNSSSLLKLLGYSTLMYKDYKRLVKLIVSRGLSPLMCWMSLVGMFALCGKQLSLCEIAYSSHTITAMHLRFIECFIHVKYREFNDLL